ncbi:putative inactive tyrosine-protein kinase Wsck [Neocloeon triangulifer]|uniref:putative inactive tyrosine-protein kinase Wsck n=1 Tax=Neocloeon triangulifer TaxID=2078957 RepID=UPI00286F5657|nr:putative inactive tyrosine-protein kinase Wsck [Neocloeon triangulifer]XP_059469462.1 putative inactive tyrosine-protein kinase Wsck [Neocloeon triangulifer]
MESNICRLFFTFLSLCCLLHLGTATENLPHEIGCYTFRNELKAKFYEIPAVSASSTVENCLKNCLNLYYGYASLKNGDTCFCSSNYEDTGPGNCSSHCTRNSSQICGGSNSISVYATGQLVPGPPELRVVKVTEKSILVNWKRPKASNGPITGYTIFLNYLQGFSIQMPPMEWEYAGNTSRAQLAPLHPGTEYNLSISAISGHGVGVPAVNQVWTEIGEPDEPDVPKVLSQDENSITIEITPAKNRNGPVSAYQVIVLDETVPTTFNESTLFAYALAQKENIPYYITAELNPNSLDTKFVVGDGKFYGGYYNAPLAPEGHFHISLAVISLKDGVRKSSFAHATHEQHGVIVLDVGPVKMDTTPSMMVMVLSFAIAFFSVLLILSVIFYFVMRHRVHQRRLRLPDNQELSIQGPILEVEGNGYIHNGYIPEDEDERTNHLEVLKAKIWSIPVNHLEVRNDLLGSGKYGSVLKGTVNHKGFPVPVAIHSIADVLMSKDDRKSMLKDLDMLVRPGTHDNLISLIGTCEHPEILYVAIEHHPATLKDVLLESRILEHSSPEQQASLTRFCSLSEHSILNTLLGIADGMKFLEGKNIFHKKLCASQVIMADGVNPKISGLGLSEYCKTQQSPLDLTRWTAQEIFRSGHFTSKSDVWSFACLAWEALALGGTPYPEIANRELPARIMRGLILPQLQHVGDELYQLLLQCWQVDLDERPSFEQLVEAFHCLLDYPMHHLSFSLRSSFQYEPFLSDIETSK